MLNSCLSPRLADLDPFSALSIGYAMIPHPLYTPVHSGWTFEMNQLGPLWFDCEEKSLQKLIPTGSVLDSISGLLLYAPLQPYHCKIFVHSSTCSCVAAQFHDMETAVCQ